MLLHPYCYLNEIEKSDRQGKADIRAPSETRLHPKLLQFILNCFAILGLGIAPAGAEDWLDFSVPEAKAPEPAQKLEQPPMQLPPENPLVSAKSLFASKTSPGSIAVGVAEGNMTTSGDATRLYRGHIDPGNGVTNRGFCSWNRSKNLTVAEADRRCLSRLKIQAKDTETKLEKLGIPPQENVEALVNGTDLSNQSPRAGADFAARYSEALDKKLTGSEALVDARVESFRKKDGELSASGLFRICRRESYYRQQLKGLKRYSEAWRWQCIALDQGRRVRAIAKALDRNLPENNGSLNPSSEAGKATTSNATQSKEPAVPEAKASDRVTYLDFGVVSEPAARLPEKSDREVGFGISNSAAKPEIGTRENSSPSALDFNAPMPKPPPAPEPVIKPPAPTAKPEAEAATDVFSGTPITKAGIKIGNCRTTDYRRYRSVHPVPGVPPRWHNGIDVACPGGTHEVYSPVAGTLRILRPAQSGGGGLVARIQTDDGWTIQNMHMLEITAKPGKISAGQRLGTGGAPKNHPNAGLGTGPHSHYERFEVVNGKRRYVTPTDLELKALLGK
ncbi:MAG: M23 family metallopeptidase [Oscillatoria sp. SIO1A7]|nr:M23 family metallopeptidase [Oscillatoria sp. SIO1A7]